MPGDRPLWLATTQGAEVALLAKGDGAADSATRFVVQTSVETAVLSGMFVFLKSSATGRLVEVDGADVKAKNSGQGGRHRIRWPCGPYSKLR